MTASERHDQAEPESGCGIFATDKSDVRALPIETPVLDNCYEMFRAGFFGEEVRTHFSGWYPLIWSVALVALGIWGRDRVRDRFHFG